MDDYKPTISRRVRDIAYFITLGVAATNALVVGVAVIWLPDLAANIAATGGVVTTVMGIIGGGLGVVYRPGAQAKDAQPADEAEV